MLSATLMPHSLFEYVYSADNPLFINEKIGHFLDHI